MRTKRTEHVRTIRIEADALVVEDEALGADPVSTLVLARDDVAIEGSIELHREPRTLSERPGERRPAHALVQRGVAFSRWRIPIH